MSGALRVRDLLRTNPCRGAAPTMQVSRAADRKHVANDRFARRSRKENAMNARILASARTFALAAAAATAMVLSGCNATMTDVWQDGDYDGPGLHKVLVVADWKDEGARRLWEDQLRASFAKQHVEAVPSYRVSSA